MTIEPRKNKKGEVISYRIRVAAGMDSTGKQLRREMTWKPPAGLTARQVQAALKQAAAQFEQQITYGYQTDNRMKFSEYAQAVIDQKERNGVKHSTVTLYRNLLPRINAAIGHIRLNDLRPGHLNDFYRQLQKGGIRIDTGKAQLRKGQDLGQLLRQRGMSREALARAAHISHTTVTTACRGQKIAKEKAVQIAQALNLPPDSLFQFLFHTEPLAPKTVIEYHRLIHSILAQAEKEMLVPYNAAAKATPPKLTHKEPNYFQVEELIAIQEALETEPLHWRAFTILLMVTGCRRGEISGLTWEKVDLKHGSIRIDANLLYTKENGVYVDTPKTGEARTISIPAEVVTLLRQHRTEQRIMKMQSGDRWTETGYVFTNRDGKPLHPSSIASWLTRFSKRHNLPHINAHAFRHSAASILIQNGTDVLTVSKRLGHSRTSTTTDIYSHILQQSDSKASECLADVVLRRRKAN